MTHHAIGYVRASTRDQRLSAAAQCRALEEAAERRGMTLTYVAIDQGVSGRTAPESRPGWRAVCAAAASLRARTVLVLRRDRLARNVVNATVAEAALRRRGVRIETATGPQGDEPEAMFLRAVLDAVSALEADLIAARVRDALGVLRARGLPASGEPRWGTRHVDGRVAPVAHERALADRVAQLRADGRTLRAIVAALAREGHRNRAGKPLTLTAVARIAKRCGPLRCGLNGPRE